MPTSTPVFPLNIPLLPKINLPLQIFERRYLDMITRCFEHSTGFVVVLLKGGQERHELRRPGATIQHMDGPPFYTTGCCASIVDFGRRSNGFLSITVRGAERCTISHWQQQTDGLWVAQKNTLPEVGNLTSYLSQSHHQLLKRVISEETMTGMGEQLSQLSAEQSMNYLISILSFSAEDKQRLIEIDDLEQRAKQLAVLIGATGTISV